MPNTHAYGIDFGTTNSTIAIMDRDNTITQLPIEPHGSDPSIMRSVIFADMDGSYRYGTEAINTYNSSVANATRAKKKVIHTGRYIKVSSDPTGKTGFKPDKIVPEILEVELSNTGRLLQGLKTLLGSDQLPSINIYGTPIPIEQLIGNFIGEMKLRADKLIGHNVTKAIVGRPVEYHGGNNQQALERMTTALAYAGFTEIEFEYEPVGAATEYGINKAEQSTDMVFDFGGGTFDCTIIRFPDNQVLSTAGIPIGGDQFNSKVFSTFLASYFGSQATYGAHHQPLPSHIFRYLQNWFQISLLKTDSFYQSIESFYYQSSNPTSIKALKSLVEHNLGFSLYEEIERIKKWLSHHPEALIEYQNIDIDIKQSIKRSQFESVIRPDLIQINDCISQCLKDANISENELSSIITTGGSSLIPAVKTLLVNRFGRQKLKTSHAFSSVASGLAIKARQQFHPVSKAS